MTKINKLVMHGFKSFAKRIEMPFGPKFNSVLGPNGSGKSNVIDALCFVLGRISSKSLRAEKSANLIYNGGKSKKPASFGLVEIHFDNTKKEFPFDTESVVVSRKILPTGMSVYKINEHRVTRKEILEMLNLSKIDPDGYNIILQGDIIKFTEMSADKRRELIEEIADISVYEEKKRKAVRELDKVDEKLKEAHIVLSERKTYLDELKEEHDQAKKYKEMKDKIDSNKATYFYLQIESKTKKKKELLDKIEKIQKQVGDFEKEIDKLNKERESKIEHVNKINHEVEEKGEKGQVDMHKVIEELKIEINGHKLRVETCKEELSKIKNRRLQLKKSVEDLEDKTASIRREEKLLHTDKNSLDKEKESLLLKLQVFRKKHNLEGAGSIEEKIEGIDSEVDEMQKDLDILRLKQQELIREKDRLEILLGSIDSRMKKLNEVAKEHKKELEELKVKKQEFKRLTIEINHLITEESALAAKLAQKRTELLRFRDELTSLQAKSGAIKTRVAGNLAIQKIIENKNKIRGIFGSVSDLGKVSSKYSMALDIAAGGHLKDIVVDNTETASKCISFLKENRFGFATLLPLNKIRAFDIHPKAKTLAKAEGCHGLAVDLVNYDPQFSKIFRFIFRNTLIVDNLNVAKRIGIGEIRMVTLDGDICETSGAMIGGFRVKREKALGFQEQEVTKNLDDLSARVSLLESTVKRMENTKEELQSKIYELRQKKAELEGDIIKQEKSLHLDSDDIGSDQNRKVELEHGIEEADNALLKIAAEINQRLTKMTQVKQEKEKLRMEVGKIRDPRVLAEMNTYNERLDKISEELNRIKMRLNENAVRVKEMYGKEADSIKQIMNQLDKEEKGFNTEMESKSLVLEKLSKDLSEKEKKAQEFYSKYKELFKLRNKLSDEARDLEKKISELNEKVRDEQYRLNGINLDKATVSAQIAGLEEEFEPFRNVERVKDKGIQQLKRAIDDFEKVMVEFGAVNLKALEIYDKVKAEYEELLNKKEKLHEEKDEVMKMMEEIEARKEELFMKTFDVLKDQFETFFQKLSGKGQAHLQLENPAKPLDGGVNIKVRLSSKRYMDIRSLSGGEKTLTALAFIFAIQEFDPATFYVLDEVDAALDKTNSEKLAKMVKSYSTKAQYIVISHNDYVIQTADTLFGVSMDKDGISQVISLKV
jgi:chromosome segregation protein